MNRLRLLIMVLGPAPIVGASLAVSAWLRPEREQAPALNAVVVRAQSEAETDPIDGPSAASSASTRDSGDLSGACLALATALESQLGDDCSVIVQEPFIIAGDQSAESLQAWHSQTIQPAAQAMAHCYFRTAPGKPITVLLFSSDQSYSYHANKLFGENNVSVYGYYKPRLRTLVMNIGTGGGTLVHELTHALIDFDFPRAPDWFNEGLASLHEQCAFREDESGPWIEGLVNWRLPGLQRAIRAGRLRSLEALVEGDDFRGSLEGMNYAQARYFCLFLQEQGVLREFFQQLRRRRSEDRFGAETARRTLGGKPWAELDRQFQEWVMTLRYDGPVHVAETSAAR